MVRDIKEQRYDEGWSTRNVILATVAGMVLLTMISWGAWVIHVATSGVRGAGNAIVQKNDVNNRIAAQEGFEDRIADIKATDLKLDQAASDKKERPSDRTVATVYSGLHNHCLDAVGGYNAAARKFTAAQFRASDLPTQIDLTDPTTDCKESK